MAEWREETILAGAAQRRSWRENVEDPRAKVGEEATMSISDKAVIVSAVSCVESFVYVVSYLKIQVR